MAKPTPTSTGIRYVRTTAVYVSNQARAEEFYTRTLGFEVRARVPMGPNGSWLEVSPPGCDTRIVLYPRAMMPGWESMRPSLVLSCEDTRATHEALAANGVTFTQEPKEMPWGFVFAIFEDPDGNWIGLTNQS